MLIKIGNAWVDPEQIALFMPDHVAYHNGIGFEDGHELLFVLKDCAETPFSVEATMDEAEAALIDAGLIENPYPEDDDEAPELSTEERVELEAFDIQGFAWLARDADGKVFAYKEKPALENGYFFSPGATQPVQAVGAFAFLQPCDFTAIPFLLCP